MGNKIKAGDTVEIVAISRESAHYDDRKIIIGQIGVVSEIPNKVGKYWKSMVFSDLHDTEGDGVTCIFGVKVRRVKQ